MSIQFTCPCGKSFRVPDDAAGKRGKCSQCGNIIVVPQPEPEAEPEPDEPLPQTRPSESFPSRARKEADSPASRPRPPAFDERAKKLARQRYKNLLPEKPTTNLLDYAYWLLLLTFIPLTITLLFSNPDDTKKRLERSLEKALQPLVEKPPAKQKSVPKAKKNFPLIDDEPFPFEDFLSDNFIDRLPGGRIEGAFLPRKTYMHWVFALLSAAAFFGIALFLFPEESASAGQLLLMGLFTATIGIVLLLVAQFLADWTQSHIFISRNVVLLFLFWIAWAIGFSYRAALDPTIDFVPSFLGYTFGVGFCEEACKALPLLWHYRVKGAMPWRAACTWGFASGVGFGVAEGVMYSADFYNGIEAGDIYLVRFVSCVALHGIWTASVALFIHRFQHILQADFTWYEYVPRVLFLVGIPMILHGLYDTFLKKDMNLLALLVGLASFAWFAWSVEKTREREETPQTGRA